MDNYYEYNSCDDYPIEEQFMDKIEEHFDLERNMINGMIIQIVLILIWNIKSINRNSSEKETLLKVL